MFTKLLALFGLQKIEKKIDPKEIEVTDPEVVREEDIVGPEEVETISLDDLNYEVDEVMEEDSNKLLTKYTGTATIRLYRLPQSVMVGTKLKLFITVTTDGKILIRTSLGERILLGEGDIGREQSKPDVETTWSAYIKIDRIIDRLLNAEGGLKCFFIFEQFYGDKLGRMIITQTVPRQLRQQYPDSWLGAGECRSDKLQIVESWVKNIKHGN